MKLDLGGEQVCLMAERALYADSLRTLFVADLHIGKTATLRSLAVPIPVGTTASDLCRLSALLRRTGAEHLVVLGDLLHARRGRAPSTLETFSRWRDSHQDVQITLVRGNHDYGAGDPPEEWNVRCVSSPFEYGAFVLCHKPSVNEGGYTLAGHIHPAVRVSGKAREALRLPCFHAGPRVMVLPAFGSFTGTAYLERKPGDRIFAIAGEEVIEV
jgi:DNA ligase-associated metallophosphoesterase